MTDKTLHQESNLPTKESNKDDITEDNITEDNITEDNITEDNITEDNITEDNITEDRFVKTVLIIKDASGNTVFGWLLKITEKEKQQILQGIKLLDLVKNTTIDMTPREKSLLDLLLEQSLEKKGDNTN